MNTITMNTITNTVAATGAQATESPDRIAARATVQGSHITTADTGELQQVCEHCFFGDFLFYDSGDGIGRSDFAL